MSGNGAEDGSGSGKPATDGDLSARLKSLETQLDRQGPPKAAPGGAPRFGSSGGASPLGQAMRLSTEFVAGVIAGGILGWIFDRLLGTAPWGLMVFVLLGFVTGIYNVMRLTGFGGGGGTGSNQHKK